MTSSSSITETDRSCRDRSKDYFCGRSSRRRNASIFGGRLGTDAAREGSFNLRRRRRCRDAVDAARESPVSRVDVASRRRRSAQGKTKVILPLFCMAFLSSNKAVRDALARGGREKRCLVVLVPEHLVPDARAQVYRSLSLFEFQTRL